MPLLNLCRRLNSDSVASSVRTQPAHPHSLATRLFNFLFMLNTAEPEFSIAHKQKMLKRDFSAFKLSDVFIMRVNVIMPKILGI